MTKRWQRPERATQKSPVSKCCCHKTLATTRTRHPEKSCFEMLLSQNAGNDQNAPPRKVLFRNAVVTKRWQRPERATQKSSVSKCDCHKFCWQRPQRAIQSPVSQCDNLLATTRTRQVLLVVVLVSNLQRCEKCLGDTWKVKRGATETRSQKSRFPRERPFVSCSFDSFLVVCLSWYECHGCQDPHSEPSNTKFAKASFHTQQLQTNLRMICSKHAKTGTQPRSNHMSRTQKAIGCWPRWVMP